jgi:hypothetical protein
MFYSTKGDYFAELLKIPKMEIYGRSLTFAFTPFSFFLAFRKMQPFYLPLARLAMSVQHIIPHASCTLEG